ncbi:SixA phosphatase family protein [Flavobacterium sp. JP2137]|uniref:SixA phosphatase family protein n=1 Tax=Flavobacterium sp. JP2137 TaxID=3414510 RepID=UPI003D2FABDE
MKKLILIRHAKSSWNTPVQDHDRPLSKKGINDAHKVSDVLVSQLPKTAIIWTSTAKRARETAVIFAQNFLIPLESLIQMPDLYTFESSELEKIIKSCENRHANLILFGHNDAITKFVNKFGDLSIENVPTTGVVEIDFDTDDWNQISKGKIVQTIFPRDLQI